MGEFPSEMCCWQTHHSQKQQNKDLLLIIITFISIIVITYNYNNYTPPQLKKIKMDEVLLISMLLVILRATNGIENSMYLDPYNDEILYKVSCVSVK